jgi:hypothetical protein
VLWAEREKSTVAYALAHGPNIEQENEISAEIRCLSRETQTVGLDPVNWTTETELLDKICPLQNLRLKRQSKLVENKTSNGNNENEIPKQEQVTMCNANTRENTCHTTRR